MTEKDKVILKEMKILTDTLAMNLYNLGIKHETINHEKELEKANKNINKINSFLRAIVKDFENEN